MPNIQITVSPAFQSVGQAFKLIQLGAVLQRAISRFAFLVERESKKVTPVDTGRLRASIATDIGNLRARIAPHTDYAGFVHEGTRFMPARPFMLWGVETAKSDEAIFGNEIKIEIESKLKGIK